MSHYQEKRLLFLGRITALLMSVLAIALALFIYFERTESVYEQFALKQGHTVESVKGDIGRQINVASGLALTLASVEAMADFASGQPDDPRLAAVKSTLLNTFMNIARTRPAIQQIRFIDLQGMERLRVDSKDGVPSIVADARLQYKGDRYYVLESLAAEQNTWVSQLDLNVENGIVEIPFRPTIRTTAKVFVDGVVKGLVVVNLDETRLINRIDEKLKSSTSWLVNSEGYFLSSPDDRNWGWMLGRQSHNALSLFEPVWQEISGWEGNQSGFVADGQYWAMRIQAQAGADNRAGGEYFYVVTRVSDELYASLWAVNASILAVTVLVLLAIFLTFRSVRALTLALVKEHDLAITHSRAKAEFLARMSHEIRTPINGVTGFLQLLRREPQSPQSRIYLEEAEGSVRVLRTVIDDILDMSKIEAGQMSLDCVDFDLDRTVQMVGKLSGQLGRDKHLSIMFDFDPQRPHNLKGDPVRLQQILLNLVSNAIKFTEQGSVCVCLEALAREPGRVQLGIEVSDTGVGMSEETLEALFTPFTQGSHNEAAKHGGTGLGLAITRQLVSMMGGNIDISSKEGEGTTVSLNIWLEVNEALEAERPGKITDQIFNALVFSKHLNTAVIVRRQCASLGWTAKLVMNRADFDEYLQQFSGSEATRTVALVDEEFLDANEGADWLLSWIAEQPQIASVLLISHNYEAYGEQSVQYLDGFIVKPFTPSTLYDAVLEATRDETESAQDRVTSVDNPAEHRLDGVHILMAEDNRVNQMVGIRLLEELGAKVTLATNGLEAVALIEEDASRFDLVLMDMQMPEMDGIEATRRIRSQSEFDQLPIIALTANALAEDRIQCLEAGMQDHMAKPFDAQEMVKTIRKYLSS